MWNETKIVARVLNYPIHHRPWCDRIANGIDGDCRCGLLLVLEEAYTIVGKEE